MSAYFANPSLVIALLCAADLSTKKGFFVKKGADDSTVALVTGATDASLGVVLDGQPAGGHNAIAFPGCGGVVLAKVGGTPGTIGLGTKLQLNADGTVSADDGSGARRLVAEALESGTTDELIRVRLIEPVVLS